MTTDRVAPEFVIALKAVVAAILIVVPTVLSPPAQALPSIPAHHVRTVANQGCPSGILPRRDVRDLSAADWTQFTDAVRRLQQQRPAGSVVTSYDTLVRRHLDNATQVHGFAPYMPWHRYYLRQFEIRLQAIDPGLTIPYWDWSRDSQAPERSVIWTYMGGNGANLPTRPVLDGPFATWIPAYRQPHQLSRRWDQGNRISPFPSSETVTSSVRNSAGYNQLRLAVEVFYAQVSVQIGGDMGGFQSPNDPVYLLHLAYMDKLWSDWQQLRPANATAYGGRNSDGTAAQSSDRLPGFVATVRDTFNISSFCYRYLPPSR